MFASQSEKYEIFNLLKLERNKVRSASCLFILFMFTQLIYASTGGGVIFYMNV